MAGLSNLGFQHGLEVQNLVTQRFGLPVSPPPSQPNGFFLVASFGSSAVRLNEDSVGLLLQSCIGGIAKDFLDFTSFWMDVSFHSFLQGSWFSHI